MKTNILAQYEEQLERVRHARDERAEAKATFEKKDNACRTEEAELHRLRSVLERAISAAEPEALDAPGPAVAAPPTDTPPVPDGIRQSLWELLLCIPVDGDVDMDTFRSRFGISDGAINSRIAKAKKRKYIESAGWGRYKLTDKGKELVARRGLRLVEVDE